MQTNKQMKLMFKTATKSEGKISAVKQDSGPAAMYTTQNLLRIKLLFLFAGRPSNLIPKILL